MGIGFFHAHASIRCASRPSGCAVCWSRGRTSEMRCVACGRRESGQPTGHLLWTGFRLVTRSRCPPATVGVGVFHVCVFLRCASRPSGRRVQGSGAAPQQWGAMWSSRNRALEEATEARDASSDREFGEEAFGQPRHRAHIESRRFQGSSRGLVSRGFTPFLV